MALPLSTGLIVLLGLVFAYFAKRFLWNKGHERPLPPGPKGIPMLGNVKDLPNPGMLECHHWLKHKDVYGPISSITVLGQTFVVINDAQIALELLRDRSAISSGRPHMVFSCDLVGWKNTIGFCQYTDTFKLHRKNMAKVGGSTASLAVFDRVQEAEAAHFLINVMNSPENLFDHIKREAVTVILKIIYGYTAETHGRDYFVDLAGKTMQEFGEASVPGKWAVDIFPFLRYAPEWLPGTGFKKTARQMAAQLTRTAEQPYQFVKQQMREKRNKTSFLSQAIESIGSDPAMEDLHKWSAASMYTGGADTTVSSLMTFFLAMTVFPEVQKKAQEELDRVIGSGRLPVSADRKNLPYIEAIMKETHRWHPVAPMGLPHCTSEEDEIRGYRIPKGALLLPNNWWFTHDPSVYSSPETFNPDRFIDSESHTAEVDPRTWIFGYGRRICPGRLIADSALFLTIAQSLAVFKIEKVVENGVTVEPKVEFESGVVSHPRPYRTSIRPRNEKHALLIREAERVYPWEESDAKALEDVRW